jgi:arylsulfatase A-like enzyme
MDLFRTFAAAAGVKGETGLDGLNLVPLLQNPQARLDRKSLFFHYPHYYPTTTPVSAIREGDWKLLEYFEDQHVELYHLREDPGEQTDLAARQLAQAERLRRRLAEWRQAVGAGLPTINPNAPR